jgi:chemotaxis protein CheD
MPLIGDESTATPSELELDHMITSKTIANTTETLVGMGQIAAGAPPQTMKAVVGSCIALALYHPRLRRGAMAHIVLPDSAGRDGAPGKFANTAVPRMLELLRELNAPAACLTAKLAGGANMFGSAGPLQIGDANIGAVAHSLRAAGIRIAAQDVGGNRGRRVTFDCEGGAMIVESAGQPTKTL